MRVLGAAPFTISSARYLHIAAIIGAMIRLCGKFEFGFEVRRLIESLHLSYKRNGILLFSDMWNMNPASISSDKDR